MLTEMNPRDRFSVMLGGRPATQEWTDEIGADGYGKSAIEAVEAAIRLMAPKA